MHTNLSVPQSVSQPKRQPGRPKDPLKRQSILDAAERHFLTDGYERTSLDSIADSAGVSKLTVYSHFKGKESLFHDVIGHKCEQLFRFEGMEHIFDLAPRDALIEIAMRVLETNYHPEILALYREVIAESGRNRKVAEVFFAAGPQRLSEFFIRLYDHFAARGRFVAGQGFVAFDRFTGMLRGCMHMQLLLGLRDAPPKEELRIHAESCVDVLLSHFTRA